MKNIHVKKMTRVALVYGSSLFWQVVIATASHVFCFAPFLFHFTLGAASRIEGKRFNS